MNDNKKIENKDVDRLTHEYSAFITGAFYALSFVFFLERSKPSMITIIAAAGGALMLSAGKLLLDAFLLSKGIYDKKDGWFGKYKDFIIPLVVHLAIGWIIYLFI